MSSISLLTHIKKNLIFPGSLIKSTPEDLKYIYEDAFIISQVTQSGYQIGLISNIEGNIVEQSCNAFYLLYFYGNGMALELCHFEFTQFRQLGLNVLIPEYLGYGVSSGIASEFGCYEAADAAYSYLTTTLHVPPSQIIVGGWSLGAAVAIDLAARKPIAGLITLSAFIDIVQQANAILPWIPKSIIQLLITERFDNLGKIQQVSCPIFIGHGTHDELVPFTMAERLRKAVWKHDLVTFLPIRRFGHNDLFDSPNLWEGIRKFISTLRREDKVLYDETDVESEERT